MQAREPDRMAVFCFFLQRKGAATQPIAGVYFTGEAALGVRPGGLRVYFPLLEPPILDLLACTQHTAIFLGRLLVFSNPFSARWHPIVVHWRPFGPRLVRSPANPTTDFPKLLSQASSPPSLRTTQCNSFAHFSIVPERPSPPRWDDALVESSYAPPAHTRNAYISYEPRHRSLSNEASLCVERKQCVSAVPSSY